MTLLEASKNGDINAVKELLKNGADPNMRGKKNKTPLLEACDKENLLRIHIFSEIVKLLLEYGANPNLADNDGRTPLLEAVEKEHLLGIPLKPVEKEDLPKTTITDVVKLLLEYGANPNLKDKNDRTPLHTASALYRLDTTKLLLKYGADPYLEDDSEKTPLHYIQYRPMHDFFVKYIKAEAARVKLKKLFENEPELGASANRLAKGMIPNFTNANKIYFEEFGSDPDTTLPKPWLEGGAKRRKTRKGKRM